MFGQRDLAWRGLGAGLGAAAADGRIDLLQAAVMDHEAALGADGKRLAVKERRDPPQLLFADPAAPPHAHDSLPWIHKA